VTRRETFESARVLVSEYSGMFENTGRGNFLIVGFKDDLESERRVGRGEGLAFAREVGALFCESSKFDRKGV
jgi:hypothetical protein